MNKDALDRAAYNAQEIIRETRTWNPETEPAPVEWATWFRGLPLVDAECVAYYLLLRMASDDQCFIADHAGAIKALESAIGTTQAENRRLRAELLRLRGTTDQ